MSLKEQLEETLLAVESEIDEEKLKIMHYETAQLELSGFTNGALNVGDIIPNFILPDQNDKSIELYNLLKHSPVVINFYRGSWCPYCNLALQALNNAVKQIEDTNATLVAISPQTPDNSLSTVEKLNLEFEVLSDEGNSVARAYGLVFKFSPELQDVYQNGFGLDFSPIYGSDTYELPIPATYVVGMDRLVKYAFLDVDYRKRAEPSEVINVLKNLNKEI